MTPYQKLEQDILRMPESANERSYYTPINNFLESFANDHYGTDTFQSISEESGHKEDVHVGFPDVTVRNRGNVVGWVEIKLPKEELDNDRFQKQFNRYKSSFENLVITNLHEWQLWQWDANGVSVLTKSISWDITQQLVHGNSATNDFLIRFLEGSAHEVRTPKQLAIALARKTQVLRDQVSESYQKEGDESQLSKLKKTFETTLIQNLSEHQFANMVAETIAYSLFLARLEYEEKHNGKDFNIEIARSFLPKNVPILRDLYEIILRVSQDITPLDQAIGLLVDQLNVADIERIRHKLTDHKPGEDPVIQFYEPFLVAYDPVEREARGVYYTPKPLVDYIVRGVDHILKTQFNKQHGLADESVQILDPATGSGTFLMSAVQQVHYNTKLAYGGLGSEELNRRFQQAVLQHILKHFYGFELLMAPYAVAHLKLILELERMGFNWSMTADDRDPDNNRLKIYLANSLDDPNQPPKLDLPGFHLAEESNIALDIKRRAPILAIFGNPPYSGISMNPHEMSIKLKGGKSKKVLTYIGELIEDYKYINGEHFKERKHWLQDDYVKFIRLSEELIERHGEGVVGFVTNHSYLDNPTFRGMRLHLLNTFDNIFILNLHGNSLRSEKAPDGSRDENIFPGIRQGVSIIFAIKCSKKTKEQAEISYADIWGGRRYKEEWLSKNVIDSTKFERILPTGPLYLFKISSDVDRAPYEEGISLKDLFIETGVGIVTGRDKLSIDIDKNKLAQRISNFSNSDSEDARTQFQLGKDSTTWKVAWAQKNVRENAQSDNLRLIDYRPFDARWCCYLTQSSGLIVRPNFKIMKHFLSPNIGLMTCRQQKTEGFKHILAHSRIVESSYVSNKTSEIGYSFPLYLYPDSDQISLDGAAHRRPNLNGKIVAKFANILRAAMIDDHSQKKPGDHTVISPLDIYDYVYAVLHSPNYRLRYKEFLKSDFPRIPLPMNSDIFWKLVGLGGQLRSLHLFGDDHFSNQPEILEDSNRWGIQPKGRREGASDWIIDIVDYDEVKQQANINHTQYFSGIEADVWYFCVGGYQVLEKWLKDRKKANKKLDEDDRLHFVKIAVVIRETIRIQKDIDSTGFIT